MNQVTNRDTNDLRIRNLYQKIDKFFLSNGFVQENINGEINFIKENLFCVPLCVRGLGFIIDYADSREDAEKHLHSDGDAYSLRLDDETILTGLIEEIKTAMESRK